MGSHQIAVIRLVGFVKAVVLITTAFILQAHTSLGCCSYPDYTPFLKAASGSRIKPVKSGLPILLRGADALEAPGFRQINVVSSVAGHIWAINGIT